MAKTDSDKPGHTHPRREHAEEPSAASAGAEAQPQPAEDSGTERATSLAEDAEAFCANMERFYLGVLGKLPSAAEMGGLRAQQAAARDLVRRAASSGGEGGEELAAVTAERDKLKDGALRARADFLNYQARAAKDLERAEELALRRYVADLLPVLDALDLALQNAGNTPRDAGHLKEALELVAASLKQALAVRGLERISAAGKPYDPNLHEAVALRPADPAKGEKPNTVLEELRAGYLWKGLLLRPVQVLVTEPDKQAKKEEAAGKKDSSTKDGRKEQ